MKRYTEEPGKRTTLSDIGLGGIEFFIHFTNAENMQVAAGHLMKCHPHHFAVLPDQNFALAMSAMGAECIKQAAIEGKIEL